MAGKRVRNIRYGVAGAFRIGFRRINQRCCLLQIFLCCEYQHVNLLLSQGRRQAHNPLQAVRAHHARFLIAKVAAREESRRRQVLVQNQHVRCKDAGLLVHFTGQGQRQLTDIRRNTVSRDRAGNARDIQLLTARRELG